MNCPTCDVQLMMTERQSVEINYCPKCRGVWIDRGGLDKIIDRAAARDPATDPDGGDHERHEHDGYRGSGTRHRKSLFSDLFD